MIYLHVLDLQGINFLPPLLKQQVLVTLQSGGGGSPVGGPRSLEGWTGRGDVGGTGRRHRLGAGLPTSHRTLLQILCSLRGPFQLCKPVVYFLCLRINKKTRKLTVVLVFGTSRCILGPRGAVDSMFRVEEWPIGRVRLCDGALNFHHMIPSVSKTY